MAPTLAPSINGPISPFSAIPSGANQHVGSSVLSGGTVVVSNTLVTANSLIILTTQSIGGVLGITAVTSKTAGVGFTITSANIADTSTVAWIIIN